MIFNFFTTKWLKYYYLNKADVKIDRDIKYLKL